MLEQDARTSQLMEWFYYAMAALGIVGTQAQLARMPMDNLFDGTVQFWINVTSRPSSLFLTVDLLVVATVVFVWMFSEARRLKIRFVWIYFLGANLIAISFFVPLFLGVRQRRLRAADSAIDTPLAASDWIGVTIGVACGVAATAYSLSTVI